MPRNLAVPIDVMHRYHESMYKNKVPTDAAESPTAVRVRAVDESDQAAAEDARRLAQMGVKTLIFPNAEVIRVWRERIAALA